MREGGFALVTGDVGTGKSVTLRDVTVGTLTHPRSRVEDFYRELGELFGTTCTASNRWGGFTALREKWHAHIDATLMRPVLLIDEAQEMYPEVLSELRVLTSTCFDSRVILTVCSPGTRLPEMFRREELVLLGSRMRVRMTHEYAAGNYRVLLTMAAEQLDAAREQTTLDEMLYLEVFAPPAARRTAAPAAKVVRR